MLFLKVFATQVINIYMNYLVPMFDGVVLSKTNENIFSNVKYKILSNLNQTHIVMHKGNGNLCAFNLEEENENVLKVKHGLDVFYFLFSNDIKNVGCSLVKHKNKDLLITVSNMLTIVYDGVLICEKIVDKINFSHSEILGDLCFLYFNGNRNYLCVIKDGLVEFCDYYDECNISANEKYFMTKLCDCLNHGRVLEIKENNLSQYLVYLDEYELNLKEEFVPFVFLDCVLAGNFKYCNNLLDGNLKLNNANEMKSFFPDFDFYYPIREKVFALFKKNTLAGIFEFEIDKLCISNIKQL